MLRVVGLAALVVVVGCERTSVSSVERKEEASKSFEVRNGDSGVSEYKAVGAFMKHKGLPPPPPGPGMPPDPHPWTSTCSGVLLCERVVLTAHHCMGAVDEWFTTNDGQLQLVNAIPNPKARVMARTPFGDFSGGCVPQHGMEGCMPVTDKLLLVELDIPAGEGDHWGITTYPTLTGMAQPFPHNAEGTIVGYGEDLPGQHGLKKKGTLSSKPYPPPPSPSMGNLVRFEAVNNQIGCGGDSGAPVFRSGLEIGAIHVGSVSSNPLEQCESAFENWAMNIGPDVVQLRATVDAMCHLLDQQPDADGDTGTGSTGGVEAATADGGTGGVEGATMDGGTTGGVEGATVDGGMGTTGGAEGATFDGGTMGGAEGATIDG